MISIMLLLSVMLGELKESMALGNRQAISNHAITISQIQNIIENREQDPIPYGPYLAVLRMCESGWRDSAINPKDTDGTPSLGPLQFKIGTFINFGKKYGILPASTTRQEAKALIFTYKLQRDITIGMLNDPEVNIYSQFPACTKKYDFLLQKKS